MLGLPAIHISPLNRTELAHVLGQYLFRKAIKLADSRMAWSDFEEDCRSGLWIQAAWPSAAWRVCAELASKHGSVMGMRTLDSLHVACALELGAERFWTFDERQARLAQAVGLNTAA